LEQHGIRQRRELSVLRPYLGPPPESRLETIRELLALTDPPTAVLCSNGYVLAGAVHDLTSLGVQIPDEIVLPIDIRVRDSSTGHLRVVRTRTPGRPG
jgi:GntR family transcriptional regulator of arabinose operon